MVNWTYPDDAQDTPLPSHLLYFLYSKLHSQLPINVNPNTSYPKPGTLVAKGVIYIPLSSSPKNLYLTKEDIQHECEHDPRLQLPLKYGHSQHYISVSLSLGNELEHRLLENDSDTSLPRLYELSFD